MSESTKSSLIDLLVKTRDIAGKHLTATIENSMLYEAETFGEKDKLFVEEMFAGLNNDDRCDLKRIEQKLLDTYPSPKEEVNHLTKLLGVWLIWYFGGVPAVQLWQQVLGRLRRDVALPTFAFKMKAYGDVYRIERRRYDERAKLSRTEEGAQETLESLKKIVTAEEGLETLKGIVTVVDHSTITHPNEEKLLLDPRISITAEGNHLSAGNSPAAKGLFLEKFLNLGNRSSDEDTFCITALTEILARHYCSVQIFRYVKKRLPLRLFLKSSESEILTNAKTFSATRLETGCDQFAYLFPGDSASVEGVPVCVIGTHTGVVREDGQWLGSPAGRKFETRRFTDLAEKVGELEKKSDKQQIFP